MRISRNTVLGVLCLATIVCVNVSYADCSSDAAAISPTPITINDQTLSHPLTNVSYCATAAPDPQCEALSGGTWYVWLPGYLKDSFNPSINGVYEACSPPPPAVLTNPRYGWIMTQAPSQ